MILLLLLLVGFFVVGAFLLGVSTNSMQDSPGALSIGHTLHSIGGKVLTLGVALATFLLIDKVFLPYLKIKDVLLGEGAWKVTGEDQIRAAVIRGWFTAFAAIVLAFAFGGAN